MEQTQKTSVMLSSKRKKWVDLGIGIAALTCSQALLLQAKQAEELDEEDFQPMIQLSQKQLKTSVRYYDCKVTHAVL